jgi:hypothetical protein
MPTPKVRLLVLGLLGLLALPLPAEASVKIAGGARNASFRVNANGYATVFWTTASGTRRTAVVTPTKQIRYGRRAPGRDVSHPTDNVDIPMKVALRQTPNGRFWALQSWRRIKGGPVELRFSRWRGAPTKLALWTTCCKWRSEVVHGKATFHGRPIFGYSATSSGVPLDPYGRNVYLDSMRRGRWVRMMGILTHRPTGTFRLWIRKYWRGSSYRGRIIGPNWGSNLLGPDAQGWAPSSM